MTARDVDMGELVLLHALGALDPAEAELVEQAVAADPALRAKLDAWREIAGEVAGASAIIQPRPELRARLMESVDAMTRPGRFDRFAARIAEIYDVTVDKARMFLSWIDEPQRWEASAFDRVQLIHLPAGPAWAAADCGIVRMPAGFHFPWHGHHGEELTFVLQGTVRDSSGAVLTAGSEMVLPARAEHDFRTDEGEDLLFAVRFYGIYGIELEQKK